MKESNLMRVILLALGKNPLIKLFRNNTGTGWVGNSKTVPGGVFISDPRPLHAGLIKGSSDLIGWTTVTITPEMVGKDVAIFTALEVKKAISSGSAAQINFLQQVRKSGGISGIVRNSDDVRDLFKAQLPTLKGF